MHTCYKKKDVIDLAKPANDCKALFRIVEDPVALYCLDNPCPRSVEGRDCVPCSPEEARNASANLARELAMDGFPVTGATAPGRHVIGPMTEAELRQARRNRFVRTARRVQDLAGSLPVTGQATDAQLAIALAEIANEASGSAGPKVLFSTVLGTRYAYLDAAIRTMVPGTAYRLDLAGYII